MNLSLRRSTSALLASSLLLTIGRGATLPFMTIYLSRQYSLSVDLIGYPYDALPAPFLPRRCY